jgi:ribonuclease PH
LTLVDKARLYRGNDTIVDMVYRSDNRSPDQMRPLNIIPHYISTAEGSCLIELGNTRVICTATIENSVPQFLRNSGKGWVTAEYGMLPRATLTRSPREVSKGRASGRTHEIQRLIGRSLRAVTDMDKLGERTLFVDCDVIQADGGTRTASITGAFVAMGLAMTAMVESGALSVAPIRDYVAATSVGIVDGEVMLDLCYEEDSRADVDMNLVITGSKKLVEVQATAEHRPFDDAQLTQMMALARKGIESLVARQQAVLTGLPLRQ